MGGDCSESQFWDVLLKKCIGGHTMCQKQHISARCFNYCVSARCKALHGHFYDQLLKKCINCTSVCGRHPVVCSKHCHRLPIPATTQMLLLDVTPNTPCSRNPPALDESFLLIYCLLAVCLLLLFSSLSLALAMVLRGMRVNSANPPLFARRKHERKTVVQPKQEVRLPVT